MLGDGSCRVLLYFLGYVVPSYRCFKALEHHNVDSIKEWCIYWLLLAVFTTVERLLLDWLIFWIPLYYEAKVLFVVYLWHPRTQGALNLYQAYVQPFLVSHEAAVDQNVQEFKTWVGDFLASHFHRFTQFLHSKAHVAITALQHLQQTKVDEARVATDSSTSHRVPSHSRSKSSLQSLSSEELPSVPKVD